MNYKDKLKSIESFEQLFDIREELLSEEKKYTSTEKSKFNFDNIEKCQDINFWLERVVNRIKELEQRGGCLDKIQIPPFPPADLHDIIIKENSIIKHDSRMWVTLLQNNEYTAFCLYSKSADAKISKRFGIGDCFIISNCLLTEWLSQNAEIIQQ